MMKRLLFIINMVGIFIISGCGEMKTANNEDGESKDSLDARKTIIEGDSISLSTGESQVMDSLKKDSAETGVVDSIQDAVKGNVQEMKEAPKHGSPDSDEIKKIKEEKTKQKGG